MRRIAPRPLLLISAGRAAEADFARRTGAPVWNLPDAPHGAALASDPEGYEQRVLGFLDRALLTRRAAP